MPLCATYLETGQSLEHEESHRELDTQPTFLIEVPPGLGTCFGIKAREESWAVVECRRLECRRIQMAHTCALDSR